MASAAFALFLPPGNTVVLSAMVAHANLTYMRKPFGAHLVATPFAPSVADRSSFSSRAHALGLAPFENSPLLYFTFGGGPSVVDSLPLC